MQDRKVNGQYLRFDQEKEYAAPHQPKLFLNHGESNDEEKLKAEYDTMRLDLENKYMLEKNYLESKWKFYSEMKITEHEEKIQMEYEMKFIAMQLELESKFKKDCNTQVLEKNLEIRECRDSEEKDMKPKILTNIMIRHGLSKVF